MKPTSVINLILRLAILKGLQNETKILLQNIDKSDLALF